MIRSEAQIFVQLVSLDHAKSCTSKSLAHTR
jgi:hypothetical protein